MRSMAYAMEKGARVINMSWGTEVKSDFLATAVAYAQSKGAILVASAGNEPTQKAMYPAAYRDVVAVSALDADGKLWKSSNYGDFVSVAAPGYRDVSRSGTRARRARMKARRFRARTSRGRSRCTSRSIPRPRPPKPSRRSRIPSPTPARRAGTRNSATARSTPRRWGGC